LICVVICKVFSIIGEQGLNNGEQGLDLNKSLGDLLHILQNSDSLRCYTLSVTLLKLFIDVGLLHYEYYQEVIVMIIKLFIKIIISMFIYSNKVKIYFSQYGKYED